MRFGLIRHIRQQAGKMACNSFFYDWSLGGAVPEALALTPQDAWPGDAEKGRWLCSGAFSYDGQYLELHNDIWNPVGVGEGWLVHMHGFEWLRDLRALGGDVARQQARQMVISWIQMHGRWDAFSWRPDIAGLRVSSWIALYDFFAASADEHFQDEFIEALIRQCRHLSRTLPGTLEGLPLLRGIKGLAYAGLAFEGRERWLEQALDLFETQLKKQILSDGGHVSRNPEELLEVLQITIDIRNGLLSAGYPVPEEIAHVTDRMAQALRFFRYADKRFGVFNDAQEGNATLIDTVLTRSNARGRVLKSLPQSGYERITVGRSMLMVDTGRPPAFPYDGRAHAAPLAFEFVYGKQRVFTNCGTHPLDPAWQDVLRGTAAHNALSIDCRNASEIGGDGHIGRKPRAMMVMREDTKDGVLLESSHDGYLSLNGITHRRRLYLARQGHDLRGEETLICSVGLGRVAEVALRFHLHPDVSAVLTQSGREALIRLPSGAGWRFAHSLGHLAIEDSIYLGEGARPRKCQQIVIYGQMEVDHALIKWALQRDAGQ